MTDLPPPVDGGLGFVTRLRFIDPLPDGDENRPIQIRVYGLHNRFLLDVTVLADLNFHDHLALEGATAQARRIDGVRSVFQDGRPAVCANIGDFRVNQGRESVGGETLDFVVDHIGL